LRPDSRAYPNVSAEVADVKATIWREIRPLSPFAFADQTARFAA